MTRYPTEEEIELWLKVNSSSGPVIIEPSILNFDPVLDLHNLTIQDAYMAVRYHIIQSTYTDHKELTHITGKSGIIFKEYTVWLKKIPQVKSFSLCTNGGSFRIFL